MSLPSDARRANSDDACVAKLVFAGARRCKRSRGRGIMSGVRHLIRPRRPARFVPARADRPHAVVGRARSPTPRRSCSRSGPATRACSCSMTTSRGSSSRSRPTRPPRRTSSTSATVGDKLLDAAASERDTHRPAAAARQPAGAGPRRDAGRAVSADRRGEVRDALPRRRCSRPRRSRTGTRRTSSTPPR